MSERYPAQSDTADGIVKRRPTSKTPCKRCEYVAPDDSFAPAPKGCVCRDGCGYRRKRHTYCVETRRGTECLYCGDVRRMEPI